MPMKYLHHLNELMYSRETVRIQLLLTISLGKKGKLLKIQKETGYIMNFLIQSEIPFDIDSLVTLELIPSILCN